MKPMDRGQLKYLLCPLARDEHINVDQAIIRVHSDPFVMESQHFMHS